MQIVDVQYLSIQSVCAICLPAVVTRVDALLHEICLKV